MFSLKKPENRKMEDRFSIQQLTWTHSLGEFAKKILQGVVYFGRCYANGLQQNILLRHGNGEDKQLIFTLFKKGN